ncbi:OLC1v1012619C1 [Oldenlandia corymbosa var. corymbosa]|uniref:OLC1v1012619C1 n=1 Tax=Oldenlandia corymbosa var. corymbosa TaxID=529605 RepID=A0AAV1DX01_OLDCO|nr:OLC1v1012619C1 [Oldenlandia corymbosa var. corymbosa]
MESVISNEEKQKHLQEDDKAARRKRKFTNLMIVFIILFSIIIVSAISVFVAIKKDLDAESLSTSEPEEQIKVICDLTPYPTSCFNPILTLQSKTMIEPKKTTPSTIFKLFLQASFDELHNVISSNEMELAKVKNYLNSTTLANVLQDCDGSIRESSRLINVSMVILGDDPDDEIFRETKTTSDLKELMSNATGNMYLCLSRFDDHVGFEGWRMKFVNPTKYLENSLVILEKMDRISEMFDPHLFQSADNSVYAIMFRILFFGSPFLFLLLLLRRMVRHRML